MNFKAFVLIIIMFITIINADLTGYNRMLNRYGRHIGARRATTRFRIKKNMLDQYVLYFKMSYKNNLLTKFHFTENSIKISK